MSISIFKKLRIKLLELIASPTHVLVTDAEGNVGKAVYPGGSSTLVLANKQIAVGTGTGVAGSDSLTWDAAVSVLNMYGDGGSDDAVYIKVNDTEMFKLAQGNEFIETEMPFTATSGITSFGIDVLSQKITNVANGSNPNDAVNKSQLDAAISPDLTGYAQLAANNTFTGFNTFKTAIFDYDGPMVVIKRIGTTKLVIGTNGGGNGLIQAQNGDFYINVSGVSNKIIMDKATTAISISDINSLGAKAFVTKEWVEAKGYSTGLSYKVYTALLTQVTTGAPTAIVLENTLGGTVIWSRSSTGLYYGTLTGAFTADKTILFTSLHATGSGKQFTGTRSDDNSVQIASTTSTGTFQDNILQSSSIEIRVYN